MIGNCHAKEVEAYDPHPESPEPNIETPLERHVEMERCLLPRLEFRFEKPFSRRGPDCAQKGGFNRNPNKKLKRDEAIIGSHRDNPMEQFPCPKQ